jgi:glycosyltransferase involved in cell wall biosynthesis
MDMPQVPRPPFVCHVNLARGFRGGERQTELLIRELARRGVSQRLVARRGQPLADRLGHIDGLEVVQCGTGVLAAAWAIGLADIVHVHEGRCLKAALANSLATGTPFVVTRRIQKGPRAHWLNRRMHRRAAAVAVLSRAIGAQVTALCPEINPVVIPSAAAGLSADATRAQALRSAWGGAFVVGHAGALDDSHKGQLQILAVARSLAVALPDARFVMVGSGLDEAILKSSAADLTNVVFTGQVEQVGDYLRAFDVFLFPSRHEGLGSILLDVLDLGLPVVATRVGGIPEIIEDGVNGILVKPGDVGAMQAALLALSSDAELRARLGAAGRRTAAAYTASRMAESYLALYRSILEK